MTDLIKVALIMSAPGAAGVIVGLYNSVIQRRIERHNASMKDAIVDTQHKIETLETNTNHIKDALVAAEKAKSYTEGGDDQKQRQAEIKAAVSQARLEMPPAVARQEKETGG